MTGELNDTAHDRHGHVLCDIISNIKIEGGGGSVETGDSPSYNIYNR